MFQIFIFLTFATAVLADLRCYNCDPINDSDKCIYPEKNNIKTSSCEEDYQNPEKLESQNRHKLLTQVRGLPPDETIIFECVAIYYKKGTNSTLPDGVYRDCVARTKTEVDSDLTPCKKAESLFKNGEVTKCEECQGDACNKMYVGGAAIFTVSMLFTLLVPCAALVL